MKTYYDGLNDFHKFNEQERLASSAQLVYLHLLHLNNRSGNRGYVQVSDRELETMTSLAKQSITRAKQTLKNRGLVSFNTERGKSTTFTLNFFTQDQDVGQSVGQSVGHSVGQSVGHSVGQFSRSNTQSSITTQDKTKELKTEELSSDINARTRDTYTVDDLLDYWDDELKGGRLTIEHISEIDVLVKRYGFEWVKAAMKEASDANGSRFGLNMKLFRAVVENKAKAKSKTKIVRGAESVGSNSSGNFKRPPADNGNEPWASF